MVKRIESLADAFAKLYGAADPTSDAHYLRNPGLLRAFNPKHSRDEKGRRIFSSYVAGYENLLLDLKIKISGSSRSKLGPESLLVDLVHIYGNNTSTLKYIVNFLRHSLRDDTIPTDVKLGWFIEDTEVKTNG
jgi:hypothetical protein